MTVSRNNTFFSLLIFCLVFLNIGIFFQNFVNAENTGRSIEIRPKKSQYDGKGRKLKEESMFRDYKSIPRHLPPPPPEINFTEKELNEAIEGLNLPTWSRSYVKCDNPQSEVTCSQVVHAYRVLNNWAQYIESTPFEKRKHFTMEHLYDGVGNRFSTDTTTFIIALMLNRSYIMKSSYPKGRNWVSGQAFQFHPGVQQREGKLEEYFKQEGDRVKRNIQTFDLWYTYDYNQMAKFPILYVDYLLYATMAYTHDQLSNFARENFGMHAAYFVCNFLMRIPEKSINTAKKSYSKVPANVRVFGVHLRFQLPGQFYSYNITRTIQTVIPFLKKKLEEKPTVFAFASDNPEMESAFKRHFGSNTITCETIRIADYDHESALNDIAFLEMADECLLTYRSTFSYVCAMRMGKRAWFVEKEAPDVFQASNSQATAISALFHNWDVNDWQMNRRIHINDRNEEALRYYCKYLLL